METWASSSGWPESLGEGHEGLSPGGGRQDVREVLAADVASHRARSQACIEAWPELCETEGRLLSEVSGRSRPASSSARSGGPQGERTQGFYSHSCGFYSQPARRT